MIYTVTMDYAVKHPIISLEKNTIPFITQLLYDIGAEHIVSSEKIHDSSIRFDKIFISPKLKEIYDKYAEKRSIKNEYRDNLFRHSELRIDESLVLCQIRFEPDAIIGFRIGVDDNVARRKNHNIIALIENREPLPSRALKLLQACVKRIYGQTNRLDILYDMGFTDDDLAYFGILKAWDEE